MLLVDVREPNETAVERYPDAVIVPLSSFDPAQIPDPQGRQVVFACRSGRRSVTASQAAQAQGLPYDAHLAGGILAWKAAGPADRKLTLREIVDARVALAAVRCCWSSPRRPRRAVVRRRRAALNVYNWSDYVEPTVIEAFSKETGIKVRYDTFDSNDTLETKLLAGKSGYDVVVPTAYFLRAPDQGRRVPEARQVEAVRTSAMSGRRSRGGSRSTIPATSTPSTTCGARPASATTSRRRATSSSRTVRSRRRWPPGTSCSSRRTSPSSRTAASTCWIPPTTSCRRRCTISGSIRTSTQPADLEKAADLLIKVRPSVRKFHSSEYLNALATGEICLVVGWSGDIKQAQKRAAEAKGGVEIGYAIPKGGAQMWFDNFAIPKDARNVAEAHAFIDYMLRPEVAAKNIEFPRLCQRQSREPEADRQGGARRPHRLSGRRDDDDASTPSPRTTRRRSG